MYTYRIRIFLEPFDDTTQTPLVAQVDLSIWNWKVFNKEILFQHCPTRLLSKQSFTNSILTDTWHVPAFIAVTRKRSTKSRTCCNAAPFDLDEIHCVARMATQRHVLTHFDRQVRRDSWEGESGQSRGSTSLLAGNWSIQRLDDMFTQSKLFVGLDLLWRVALATC